MEPEKNNGTARAALNLAAEPSARASQKKNITLPPPNQQVVGGEKQRRTAVAAHMTTHVFYIQNIMKDVINNISQQHALLVWKLTHTYCLSPTSYKLVSYTCQTLLKREKLVE